MNEPLTIVPGRPDADTAAELKRRIEQALAPLCEITDEAAAAGFVVNFTLGPDYRQKTIIQNLLVAKKY